MEKRADQQLKLKRAILLFPIFFLIHDSEEILTMEKWMNQNITLLYSIAPEWFQPLIESAHLTTPQVAVAVLVELILLSIVSFLAFRNPRSRVRMILFTSILTVLFLHVFTHLGQAILLQGYTPGVVTAVLVSFPYSVYLYRLLFQEKMINWRIVTISFFVGLALVPIVPFAHFVGRTIA